MGLPNSSPVSLSRVWIFATPWVVACQAPVSMGFPRQEYWSQLPFPSPGHLLNPGMEPASSALGGRWILYHWTIREAHEPLDHQENPQIKELYSICNFIHLTFYHEVFQCLSNVIHTFVWISLSWLIILKKYEFFLNTLLISVEEFVVAKFVMTKS